MTKSEWDTEFADVSFALTEDKHVLTFVWAVDDLQKRGILTEVSQSEDKLMFFLGMNSTLDDSPAKQYLDLIKTIVSMVTSAKTKSKEVICMAKQVLKPLKFLE